MPDSSRNPDGTFHAGHVAFPARVDLSEIHKRRLAALSSSEQIARLRRSALSVPRWNAGRSLPEAMRRKISAGLTRFYADRRGNSPSPPKECVGCGQPVKTRGARHCSRRCSYATRRANGLARGQDLGALWKDPIYRARRIAQIRSPMMRAKVSAGVRRWYLEHPAEATALIERTSAARRHKPNKLEHAFDSFLQARFPGEFRYVGDGTMFIARKNPDWRHLQRKLLIELFGDYWHNLEEVDPLVQHYLRHGGWACAVVWEHDFRADPNQVGEMLQRFLR